MPLFDKNQVKFYKTRQQVLQIFRAEERKKCFCSTETWAGNTNKLTCINCIRKENLSKEMDRKEFFKSNKNIKYWKVYNYINKIFVLPFPSCMFLQMF